MSSNKMLAVLLVLLIFANATTTKAQHLNPPALPSRAITENFFGLHLENADTTTPWPSVTFGSWRLWDASVVWPDLEPRKDQWDFHRLDKDVALAEQRHVSVLLAFGLTPKWASTRPREPGYYGPGSAAMPREIEDWRNYVRTVATRYKGRIHEYEIWNEPSNRHFFTGSVDEMLLLTQEACDILKKVDPSNVVVSPSALEARGLPWLEEFLRKGGGNCLDIIAYHFYVSPKGPEAMLPVIEDVKALMKKYGIANKPLWNTETGWLIQNSKGLVKPWGPFRRVLTSSEARNYVARSYILSGAYGVERFYWYSWDNPGFGLAENNGKVLKPAAHAFEQVRTWLFGASIKTCQADTNGSWNCELDGNGAHRWIVWNARGISRFRPPVSWGVTRWTTLDGRTGRIAPDGTLAVNVSPEILEH